MARLEPIRKGGLRDTKGQNKTEKKKKRKPDQGEKRESEECEEESGTWGGGVERLQEFVLAGVKQLHFNVYEVLVN